MQNLPALLVESNEKGAVWTPLDNKSVMSHIVLIVPVNGRICIVRTLAGANDYPILCDREVRDLVLVPVRENRDGAVEVFQTFGFDGLCHLIGVV